MIRKMSDQTITINENMRGGDGSVAIRQLLSKDEMLGASRLYAHVTIKPGCSIGNHVHENEMETYYILKGTGTYDDNGVEVILHPGDVTHTPHGCEHGIANRHDEDLEFMALIVLQQAS